MAHISENSRAGSDSDSGFRQEQVSDVRIFLGSQASPSVHLTDREINTPSLSHHLSNSGGRRLFSYSSGRKGL